MSERTTETQIHPSFGVRPEAANAWGLTRKEHGAWRRMTASGGEGLDVREWPLEALTPAFVKDTWGQGTYRIHWLRLNPDHDDPSKRRVAEGSSPVFVVNPEPRPAAPEPAEAPPAAIPSAGMPPGWADAINLMTFIDQRATHQIAGMAQLATLMRGGAETRTDPALLEILRQGQQSNERIMTELSAIRTALSEEVIDEEEPANGAGAVVGAAKAAAPLFKKGRPITEGLKTAFANYAVENPDKVVEIIKAVPVIIEKLSQIGKHPPPPPPPPPAPALAVVRPRAVVQATKPVGPAPKPPGPGLNALADSRPKAPSTKPAAEDAS